MKNIIAFAGRKESGKTELSNICEKHGYKRIYFAQPLKELCSIIFELSIDELNKLKYSDKQIYFPNQKLELFSELSQIPLDYVYQNLKDKIFKNSREIFQYIGTDVIRKYDNDWHAKKTKELILNCKNDKICVDDLRFPNEKVILEDLHTDIWFVIRPKFDNISNHISETALTWHDFHHIIENDETIDVLINKWDIFLENYQTMSHYRDVIYNQFDKILEDNKPVPYFDSDILLDAKNLFYPISKLTYNQTKILKENIDNIEINTNNEKQLIVTLKNGTKQIINNLLVLEDLKKYL